MLLLLNISVPSFPPTSRGFCIFSPFVLKLDKSLVLFIALSISMHLLKLFLLCIVPLFSPISPTAPLSGIPPQNSFYSTLLEKTQLFALRMCSHNWSSDYYSLLSSHNISPLSTRRSISKLCLVYKISNKLIYFPSDCFVPKPLHTHRSRHYDSLMYSVPFSRTSASKNSFVPSALSLWNPLPYRVKSSISLTEFKNNVKKIVY